MVIELRNGLWWPASDKHCFSVVPGQVSDLDEAMPFVSGRSVCVQAGGNCGIWPTHLAGMFAEVWTIEANLENYLCLVRNVRGNVKTIWAALGDKPGTSGMKVDPQNVGAHYLNGGGRIPVITIDELNLTACDLIVLDIEGMEPRALEGAKATIEKFKPVLMVEDKGLSEMFGTARGWSEAFPGYRIASRVHRDVVLVPC